MNRKIGRKIFVPLVLVGALLIGATPSFAYDVKKGDTLGNIAYQHNTTVSALAQKNPSIKDIDMIYVGQKIKTVGTASKPVASNVKAVANSYGADASTIQVFSQLVQAEAGAESYAGKVAVASVVLNRVDSKDFPDTIKEVIYQKANGYYQFSPVMDGMIHNTPSADAKRAVADALDGRNDHTSLFFYNPAKAKSSFMESRPTTYVIGGHVFKK